MTEEERHHLRNSTPERQMLWMMLDTYWGFGDGDDPPIWIRRAADLCGYQLDRK